MTTADYKSSPRSPRRSRASRAARSTPLWDQQTELVAAIGTEFLAYLGFTINPRLKEIRTPRGERVGISAERFDVADADVMVFATETQRDIAALEDPTFGKLGAVREHRAVYGRDALRRDLLHDAAEPAVRPRAADAGAGRGCEGGRRRGR